MKQSEGFTLVFDEVNLHLCPPQWSIKLISSFVYCFLVIKPFSFIPAFKKNLVLNRIKIINFSPWSVCISPWSVCISFIIKHALRQWMLLLVCFCRQNVLFVWPYWPLWYVSGWDKKKIISKFALFTISTDHQPCIYKWVFWDEIVASLVWYGILHFNLLHNPLFQNEALMIAL